MRHVPDGFCPKFKIFESESKSGVESEINNFFAEGGRVLFGVQFQASIAGAGGPYSPSWRRLYAAMATYADKADLDAFRASKRGGGKCAQ